MKVKYTGNYYKVRLIKNNVYTVISSENGWYKIVDELGEEGFYPSEQFEVLS